MLKNYFDEQNKVFNVNWIVFVKVILATVKQKIHFEYYWKHYILPLP